jgi:hypothetical protein
MNHPLTPTQEFAFGSLKRALSAGNLAVLMSAHGQGRTTILRHMQRETGGGFIGAQEFLESSGARHPLALEEALQHAVSAALPAHDIVYVDDIHWILHAAQMHYPRHQYMEAALLDLAHIALRDGKKLIVSTSSGVGFTFMARSFSVPIPRFNAQDYAALIANFAGPETASELDCEKIFRFAHKLNAHQIKAACDWLRPDGPFDTERFIDYLRSQQLGSNVDLQEVQAANPRDLQGVDDVLRSLEIAAAQARSFALRSSGHWEDNDRPRLGTPAARQVLPDRRHLRGRYRRFSCARPPRFYGGQGQLSGSDLHRRCGRDL